MFSKLFNARKIKSLFAALAVTVALASVQIAPAHAVNFAAPTLDGADYTSGPDVGGTALHLIGSNWDDVSGISVGFSGVGSVSVSAANVHTDPTSGFSFVDISTPQNLAGGVSQITVTNPGAGTTGAIAFTYYKSFPNVAQTATEGGSGAVTLNLSTASCAATTPCNFTPGATASAVINGNNLAGLTFTRNSNSSMTVHLPAHTPTNHLVPDVATVTIQNSNGYTASLTHTYYLEPNIALPPTFTAPVNAAMTPIVLTHTGGPCISWSTSGSLPAGISWNQNTETISGTTTAAAASGIFSVTCTNPGGSNTATVSFGAAKQVQTITGFTLTGGSPLSGSTPNYSTTYGAAAPVIHITSTTGNAFVVTSNDPAVVVSGNSISIVGATTGATLTAHLLETSTHAQSPDVSITLVVNKATQTINSFTLGGATGGSGSYSASYGTAGMAYAVSTSAGNAGGSVVVTSNDACVTIGANNSVTITCVPNAGAGGTATITATLNANANYAGPQTATYTLTVSKGQLGITFNPVPVMVIGGANQNLALHAALTPTGVGSPYAIAYSLDPASTNYCSLQGAVVTAIAVGPCVVRATAVGDNNMVTAPIEIRTIDIKFFSAQVLTFSGLAPTYQYGVADIPFAVSDLFGNPLVISAPNSTVATVLGSGNSRTLHILGAGSVQITATDPLTQAAKVFTITVSPRSVSAGNIVANVAPNGVVSFEAVPLIGAINGDQVFLDPSQVIGTYTTAGTVTWTGKFILAGFNAASYVLLAQPSVISVKPSVHGVTPGYGAIIGGNKITITGIGFTNGTQVSFGSMSASSVQVVSPTTLIVTTPAHNAGSVPLLVTVPGHGALALPTPFEFKELAPTISSVEPAASNITGGAGIRIIGENFQNNVVVTLDGVAITVQSVTPNVIAFVAPAHAAGSVKLTVTNPGMETATWAKDFVYSLPLTVDVLTPITSWTTGGGKVTLTGSNFATGIKVTVGNVSVQNLLVVDAKTLTFTLPTSAAAGPADVVVVGNDGLAVTLAGVIQYVSAPTLKLVFAGKTTVTTAAMNKAIARFIKRLAGAPITIKSLIISAYTANATPGLTALTAAISRAKSVKSGVKATKSKLKIVVNALAALAGKANAVYITVN